MIQLHKTSMLVMDATKYWGEFDEGTTVKDLVDYIDNKYSDDNVTIHFIGEPIDGVEFENGLMKRTIPDEVLKRRICSLNATMYYLRGRSMSFDVCLEDE